MGIYLNNSSAQTLFSNEVNNPYFVDKSKILCELFPLINQGNRYVCITRPRRFGKTVMANMISAFLGKGQNTREIFDRLEVSKDKGYEKNINNHNVIYISFNELPRKKRSYEAYIERIENCLIRDLKAAYPECAISGEDAVWDVLRYIHEKQNREKFIFVLDEWDFIFHRDFVSESDKQDFISFLSNLLKDKPYVSFAYMTGILPIAKYSSGSELNMFLEYTMVSQPKYGSYFGFSEDEVDILYKRYVKNTLKPQITREQLRTWYDGYHVLSGGRIYNPRSVVAALGNNKIGSYWTSSGPYDEIFYYIEKNIADVRDSLALMVSGESVPANVEEYAATSMSLSTRDEIFSAMVVYGFLTYENGEVSVPNRELMEKFSELLMKEPSLGYVYRLARESDRMLAATLAGDTETMEKILSYAHDTEVPMLSYNKEAELSSIVNLVYLSARDKYDIQREDKAGIGYVDFIFYPKTDRKTVGIILELKVGDTPEAAIQQIRDRKYALRFKGKLGEQNLYTGRILLVGISYNKETKVHKCRVEEY